jgi:hypothetical protein
MAIITSFGSYFKKSTTGILTTTINTYAMAQSIATVVIRLTLLSCILIPPKLKAPQKNYGAYDIHISIVFYHPDFTVGSGITPLRLALADFTAGRDFHPAPKTIYIRFDYSFSAFL